jgi:Protein of unknown function (DUF2785)
MEKAFWQSIVNNDYALPVDQPLSILTAELLTTLGSTDLVLREDLTYPVLDTWIGRGYYSSADLWNMAGQLSHNLMRGADEQGTDLFLLRSFSLLALTSIVYEDITHHWLEKNSVKQLLDQALIYLAAEKDLRGYDTEKGWLHAIAHVADYFFAFASHPSTEVSDLERIMNALADKISEPVAHVYVYDEDERLTRAVMAVLQRDILPHSFFIEWLQRLTHPQGRTALDADFESGKMMNIVRNEAETCARHNVKHFLRSLYFQLVSPGFANLTFVDEAPPLAHELLPLVEDTLKEIRTWC